MSVNCEFCHAHPGESCTSRCPNYVAQTAVDKSFKPMEWIQKHDTRWEADQFVITQVWQPLLTPLQFVLWYTHDNATKRIFPFPSLLTAQTYAGELRAHPALLENHY